MRISGEFVWKYWGLRSVHTGQHVTTTRRSDKSLRVHGRIFVKIFSPQQNSVAATSHKKSNQAEFVRLVVDFQKSPSSDLIGSFSNDLDGDSSEDVKQAVGLLRKTTTLHVHDAFFVHFFTVLARLRRESA